jgi:predicted DNA-binding transcriptional regulator AlpA
MEHTKHTSAVPVGAESAASVSLTWLRPYCGSQADPAETRYRGAVDVKRAADLYAQGRTLRQLGAELGVHWSTVSQQLQRVGVGMRRGGPPPHAASTQKIMELRDQGLTWNEVAQQVDMTVSGAWSRYRKARPPKPPRLGRWQQVLADALNRNLAIGVRAAVTDHLGRAPTRAELTAARRAAHSLAALGRARVLHVPGADADDKAGDRNYLALAKPNLIMNDTRLRRLAVAAGDGAGRRRPHNHAQTARNLRRSLRNAAAGARLIQSDGLDSKSAADVAASLADALEELHRLQRNLDRRIRRTQGPGGSETHSPTAAR